MLTDTIRRSPVMGSIAAMFLTVLAPGPVAAQTPSPDRLGAIERHINGLESEVQQLKAELRETKRQLQRSRDEAARTRAGAGAGPPTSVAAAGGNLPVTSSTGPQPPSTGAAARTAGVAPPSPPSLAAAPPGPHVVQTPGNRFGFESADGRNSIFITGRLHFDTGDYLDYRPGSKFASVQDLHSGVNARRARLGVTGKFAGDWNYTLIYDFGGSSDGLPSTAGAPTSGIQTAEMTYNGLNKAPVPLAFDLGYMTTPFTLEQATSSNDIMFVERPSSQAIAASIMAGSYRSALGVRSNDNRYWTGVYLTGPTSGAAHTTGEQMGAFGRASYQVLQNPEYSLHLGVDAGGLLKPPTVAGIRTITLSDRPELRVDPIAILSTGALGTAANPVDDAAVYGVEAAVGYRSLFAQGEYLRIDVDRAKLPTNGFNGGYVEASWTLTGEHRNYIPATGAYSGIVPAHPFSPGSNDFGFGAFELAGRYSAISLNDNFTPGVAPGTSNAVGGGKQTVYAVGLNWYPNANMRFMFDYLHGIIDKKFSTAAAGGITGTPLGTQIGGRFDALVLRSQFAF